MDPRAPHRLEDVRTGLLVLAAAVAAAGGIFFLDTFQRAFLEGPTLVVLADDVEGLEEGAAVWVAGSPSGRVRSMAFASPDARHAGRVVIEVALRRGPARSLRRDAEARIGRGALLAPSVVKLRPGDRASPPYDFRDTLTVTPVPGLADFQALGDTARSAADSLLHAISGLDAEMREGRGTLPRLRRDPATAERLARRREAAGSLVRAWRDGALRAFLADTAPRAAAQRIGERLAAVSADTTARRGRQDLAATIGPLVARLDRLAARLGAADGTLGRMATDGELRGQLDETRARLDSLRLDAAARPLRYLRLRLF